MDPKTEAIRRLKAMARDSMMGRLKASRVKPILAVTVSAPKGDPEPPVDDDELLRGYETDGLED